MSNKRIIILLIIFFTPWLLPAYFTCVGLVGEWYRLIFPDGNYNSGVFVVLFSMLNISIVLITMGIFAVNDME